MSQSTVFTQNLPTYILRLCLLLYLCAAIFSKGYHHIDEHAQLLEFAHFKLGSLPEKDLPWEYAAYMRPSFQPYIALTVEKILLLGGFSSPFLWATVLRLLSAGLSCYSLWILVRTFASQMAPSLEWLFYYVTFCLWAMVYLNVRFSSEGWAASFFTLGLCSLFQGSPPKKGVYFASGCFFGLAFLCRFHIAFACAGLFCWAWWIRKDSFRWLLLLVAGFLCVLAIGTAMDSLFYGKWVFTPWHYFQENIIEKKADGFGISPWWWYFPELFHHAYFPLNLLLPAAVLYIVLWYPTHFLTWTLIPFLAIHMWVKHKELRFLFPLMPLVPLFLLFFLHGIRDKLHASPRWLTYKRPIHYLQILGFTLCIGVNTLLLLVVCTKPAEPSLDMIEAIYQGTTEPAVFYYTGNDPFYPGYPLYLYTPTHFNRKQIPSHQVIDWKKDPEKKKWLYLPASENVHEYLPATATTQKCYPPLVHWPNLFENEGDWCVYEFLSPTLPL